MKTIAIKLYTFDELSTEAQEKALDSLSDINIDFQWWDTVYQDAKDIGLKITSFDLDRNKHCKGIALQNEIAIANAILKGHGDKTNTYKLAAEFIKDSTELINKFTDEKTGEMAEDKEQEFDAEYEDLKSEFLNALLEEYVSILQKEYEYLTSPKAIIETIQANEYTFEEDGKLRNA